MYKVLLVDDEEVIREGMTALIDWASLGFEFIGAAQNGLEAYELLMKTPVDIVITDIKMPVLDGLELIAKVKEEYPEMVFVVLSGYGEFELAKEAMGHGVKHYLLKPCNERKIIDVLQTIKNDFLRTEAKEEQFIKENREHLEKVMPLVREQFLRDFLTNRTYTQEEYKYYAELLNIREEKHRVVLYQPDGEYGVEELFGLMKIVDEFFGAKRYLTTNIKNQVLMLIEAITDDELIKLISQVREMFFAYHHLEVTIAYSGENSLAEAPLAYQEVWECLKYAFYLGTGSILTKKDIELSRDKKDNQAFIFNYDPVAVAVKSGNLEVALKEIKEFFQQLRLKMYEMSVSKTYTTELFMAIIRQCKGEAMENYLYQLKNLLKMGYLEQVQEFIEEIATRVTKGNYEQIITTHNRLITKTLTYVQENIAEENLSLKWLATEKLFINVGYLSKLFIRETGEKFSHYLTRIRMEKAKELIKENDEDLVYEVARQVGFGNNPQYFSQLFKKHTGLTPSEYKKVNF